MEENKIYKAKITSIYDGDTITATIDIGELPFLGNVLVSDVHIRLNAIDTPEIKSAIEGQRALALRVKNYLIELILNKDVEIEYVKKEKYGRNLCNVFVDGKDLSQILIKKGYGKFYDGGKKAVG